MAHKADTMDVRNPRRLIFPTSEGTRLGTSTFRNRYFVFVLAAVDMRLKSLAPDQLDLLVAQVPEELRLAVRIAALPELRGLKLAELVRLRWRDYDEAARTLRFIDTRGRERAEQLSRTLHDALLAARRDSGADWLFPGNRHMHVTRSKVLKAVFAAVDELDLWPRLRVRDLRHSYASQSVAAGINIKLLSYRLGHSSEAFTLAVYSHLYDSQMDAAADTFEL